MEAGTIIEGNAGERRGVAIVVSLMVFISALAHAAAPAVGSEDYEIMYPYREAIQGLHVNGIICCSWADGRPVRQRRCQVGDDCPDGWQVRFRPSNDIGAPFDKWLSVRKAGTSRDANPVGVPIAWYRGGAVICFWPSNEI